MMLYSSASLSGGIVSLRSSIPLLRNMILEARLAEAWYMVTECHLRLGPIGTTDNLEEVVKYIHEQYGFIPTEKPEKILQFVQNTDDKKIYWYKNELRKNVPYGVYHTGENHNRLL